MWWRRSLTLAAAVLLYSPPLLVVLARFPPTRAWCNLPNCREPSPETIARVLRAEQIVFGNAGARCGDRICNVLAGESCGNCPQDCGPCQQRGLAGRCRNPRQWSLTFNEGPNEFTDEIERELNAEGVKGAFFFTGESITSRAGQERVRRLVQTGHEVGSHTYTHRSLGRLILVQNGRDGIVRPAPPPGIPDSFESKLEFMRAELTFTDEAIFSAAAVRPRLVRPPFFALATESTQLLETMGYVAVGGQGIARDSRGESPEAALRNIRAAFDQNRNVGGWISIQRDSRSSAATVREIVRFVRSKGVELVPLSTCLGQRPYRANNANPFLGGRAARILPPERRLPPGNNGNNNGRNNGNNNQRPPTQPVDPNVPPAQLPTPDLNELFQNGRGQRSAALAPPFLQRNSLLVSAIFALGWAIIFEP